MIILRFRQPAPEDRLRNQSLEHTPDQKSTVGGAHLGGAGVAGAAASCVAGGGAGVSAVGPCDGTGLAAAPVHQTVATVTDAPALVHLAGQRLVAGQPTRDVLQVARDVAALLQDTTRQLENSPHDDRSAD